MAQDTLLGHAPTQDLVDTPTVMTHITLLREAIPQDLVGIPLAQDIPLVHITEETDENRTQDEEPSWIALLTWNQAGTRIFSS
jgi:hypothetical protein